MTQQPQSVNPRFTAALAWEHLQARIEQRPACPVPCKDRPITTVHHGGDGYSIEEREIGGFDTMSGKAKTTITVTQHSTGRAQDFGPCWWKQTRAKDGTVKQRYTSPAGKHEHWSDMVAALVALAASRWSEQGVAA